MNNIRMCILCRKRFAKIDLIRFVFNKNTCEIKINNDTTSSGRGYYLCWNQIHQKTLAQPHALNQTFKTKTTPLLALPLLEYIEQKQINDIKT